MLAAFTLPGAAVRAYQPDPRPVQQSGVTAYDLIAAMNTLRMSYGLPALVEDPIINAVAQSTAEIMAASQMSWHIGNVSGRISSAGYGGGAKVWATENFAVGNQSIDEIMVVWSDASHMIPAVNPAYCHVGAGTAKSANGMTYYVLQAAYISGKSCGEYRSPTGPTNQQSGTTSGTGAGGVSQVVMPVKIATPDADGKIYHEVMAGQSFWAIAVAYQITIKDIETWNNISKETKLQIGQRLFIPGKNTVGYSTPTPSGMVAANTPDVDGKIIHTVQSHQTLITIAQAYGTKVDTILALNGLQLDWPLQIGQKLLINPGFVTPSPTPRPLTPIEKLTPASDGNYYHIIKSGQTLSWVADLYGVQLSDLMAWNSLGEASILQLDQKLLLRVTPPATDTPTPGPATATLTATLIIPTATATPSLAPTILSASPTAAVSQPGLEGRSPVVWFVSLALASGLFWVVLLVRRKRPL
jgi:LysM repeat protein